MQILRQWGCVVALMAVIFIASSDLGSEAHTARVIDPILAKLFRSLTPQHVEVIHGGLRKMAHLVEYALVGFFVARALGAFSIRSGVNWRMALIGIAAASAFAVTDEFHQSFVPSRGACVHDVLLDSAGAIAGLTATVVAARVGAGWSVRGMI